MGCSSSTEAGAPFEPAAHAGDGSNTANAYAKSFAAFGADYCAEKPSTLYMKERCWSLVPPDEDFLIRHAETSRELFCVQGTSSASAMQTLRVAASREPIAHLRRDSIARAPTFNVFAAGPVPSKLLTIEVRSPERMHVEGGGCAFAQFSSPATGEVLALGVEGDWPAKQARMWIERRDKLRPSRRVGRRQDAARIYRPSQTDEQRARGERQHDYFVGIAGDVDAALVLLVCMALDAASTERTVL